MRGRKPKPESRGTEIRSRLAEWKRTPAFSRPSLRALARELGTSHQLLGHYQASLEKWQHKERYHEAKRESEKICARASAEGRLMTKWEEQQVRDYGRAALRAMLAPMLLDQLERIRQDAKRGLLNRTQIKLLKHLARHGFPGAEELLQKCLRDGLKERRRFADVVKETPRQEGETYIAWVRRIWNQCAKYDTKCPTVITEELLQELSPR